MTLRDQIRSDPGRICSRLTAWDQAPWWGTGEFDSLSCLIPAVLASVSCLKRTDRFRGFGCFVFDLGCFVFEIQGSSFSSFGCFVFEIGCFVFDLGCFVFEIWVLRASVFVFECFVFETTIAQIRSRRHFGENWNPCSAVIKKLYSSKEVKENALASECKSCRPENHNDNRYICHMSCPLSVKHEAKTTLAQ